MLAASVGVGVGAVELLDVVNSTAVSMTNHLFGAASAPIGTRDGEGTATDATPGAGSQAQGRTLQRAQFDAAIERVFAGPESERVAEALWATLMRGFDAWFDRYRSWLDQLSVRCLCMCVCVCVCVRVRVCIVVCISLTPCGAPYQAAVDKPLPADAKELVVNHTPEVRVVDSAA